MSSCQNFVSLLFLYPPHVKFINKFYPKIVYPESTIFPALHLVPNPNHCHLSPGLLCFSPNWSSCFHLFCSVISTPQPKFSFFIFNLFYWRIIALQSCVGFCHTSPWISHRYTYVPSLLNPPPISLEPIIQREVSQKEKITYVSARVWNLERRSWRTCLQGSSGDTDVEKRLVDKVQALECEADLATLCSKLFRSFTIHLKCPSSSQRSHIIWPTLASCCLVWTILGARHAGHIGLPVYVTTSGTFLARFFAHALHLPYNASFPGTSVFTLISVKSLLKCISLERPCLTTFIWKSCQIPIFLY